jgi:hypothetical protein
MPPPKEVPVTRELALVDPSLSELYQLRATILRMCELSDVNPPKRARIRMFAVSGVATLWLEVVLVATSQAVGWS